MAGLHDRGAWIPELPLEEGHLGELPDPLGQTEFWPHDLCLDGMPMDILHYMAKGSLQAQLRLPVR